MPISGFPFPFYADHPALVMQVSERNSRQPHEQDRNHDPNKTSAPKKGGSGGHNWGTADDELEGARDAALERESEEAA